MSYYMTIYIMPDDISFEGSLANEAGKKLHEFVAENPEIIAPVVAASAPVVEGASSLFDHVKGFVLGLFGIDDGG
jgi:hypothetical protein